VNQEEILSWARSWVESNKLSNDPGDVAREKVSDIITQSTDIVEFTLDLEEALGMDDMGFDLEELAPKLATLTFAELADEVVKLVQSRKA
jgi:hypothetical protein